MVINKEIFSRISPEKKLNMVNSLTLRELLSLREETVSKIVKQVGYVSSHSRLLVPKECTGNDWNSTIQNWSVSNGKLFVTFYVQYANTDTYSVERGNTFLKSGEYTGTVNSLDMYANPRAYYFRYSERDKAMAFQALLRHYLFEKYGLK